MAPPTKLKLSNQKKYGMMNETLRIEKTHQLNQMKLLKDELIVENAKLKKENEELRAKLAEIQRDLMIQNNRLELHSLEVENLMHCLCEKDNLIENHLRSIRILQSKLERCENGRRRDAEMCEKRILYSKNELYECLQLTPSRGSKLKAYETLRTKDSIEDRCNRVVRMMENFVGPENLNSYLNEFVKYIAKDPTIKFNLKLSLWQSFRAVVQWNLPDAFLRNFKKYLKDCIGVDVFASRHVIDQMKRHQNPEDEYEIEMVMSTRLTRTGKLQRFSSPIVRIKDLRRSLEKRLSVHEQFQGLQHYDNRIGNIVVGCGGDKGGHQTKLCMVVENFRTPNNPRGILVLGFYNGDDDHDSLKRNLGTVFDQINSLEKVKYMENGLEIERTVRKIPLGDCKFISSVFNHHGQSSIDPCFICQLTWSNRGQNRATLSTFSFEESGTMRTLESLKETGDPLLHIEPGEAAPPGIHTILGINQVYVIEWILAQANKLDCQSEDLPERLREQEKILKSRKSEEDMYSTRVKDLKCSITVVQKALALLSKPKSNRGRKRTNVGPSCSATICLLNLATKGHFGKVEMFLCSTCNRAHHEVCSMNFTATDCTSLGTRTCYECHNDIKFSSSDVEEVLKQVECDLQRELANDEEVLEDVSIERAELESILKETDGPTRRRLDDIFKSIRCDGRVHYQEMNGNQCRKFLRPDSIDKVFSVFPHSEEVRLMSSAAKKLARLMTEANSVVKTDQDIDDIEAVLREFIEDLRNAQPNASVTPKLHMLCAHLIPYMKQHKSWGSISEQGIESLHCVFNRLNQRFSAVRNVEKHTLLVLQMMCNFNFLFDIGDSDDVDILSSF